MPHPARADWQLCCLFLLLAISFRAALPTGFMPDAERGLVLCTPGGTQLLAFHPLTGEIIAGDEVAPEGCEWAPLLAAAIPPQLLHPGLPLRAGTPTAVSSAPRLLRQARAPPRARGPPQHA